MLLAHLESWSMEQISILLVHCPDMHQLARGFSYLHTTLSLSYQCLPMPRPLRRPLPRFCLLTSTYWSEDVSARISLSISYWRDRSRFQLLTFFNTYTSVHNGLCFICFRHAHLYHTLIKIRQKNIDDFYNVSGFSRLVCNFFGWVAETNSYCNLWHNDYLLGNLKQLPIINVFCNWSSCRIA